MLEVELGLFPLLERAGLDDARLGVALFAGRQMLAHQQPVAAGQLEAHLFLFAIPRSH